MVAVVLSVRVLGEEQNGREKHRQRDRLTDKQKETERERKKDRETKEEKYTVSTKVKDFIIHSCLVSVQVGFPTGNTMLSNLPSTKQITCMFAHAVFVWKGT